MILRLALTLAFLSAPAMAEPPQRILSLGGSITEIVAALGAADRLVGRDSTSTFPPPVQALPDIGYFRALSPEGILSLSPDLILTESGAGPQETLDILQAAGIPLVAAPDDISPDGLATKITTVAAALDLTDAGRTLAADVTRGLDAAKARAATITDRKRVLFILSLEGGRVMAGGAGSTADSMIRLAGGINAATGFGGYRQITDEAALAAAPDVILLMQAEGDRTITDADILSHPALSQTPAAAKGAILRMDGLLLLGFGPRTPQAASDLHALLYPAGE